MLVQAIMTRDVVTVRETDSLEHAAAVLGRHRFRHLPVVRGDQLVGLLSDRDRAAATCRPPAKRPARVGAVMRAAPIVVSPSTPVEQAARLMVEHKIGALPVVADRLVGIVTASDLLLAFCRVLGVSEPSTHLEVRLDDAPDALARLAGVLRDHRVAVARIVTEPSPDGQARHMVLRLRTIYPNPVLRDLAAAGIAVVGPEGVRP